VKESLTAMKVPIEAAEIANLPNNTVPVQGEVAQRILKLIDALEDNDDVQSVSHNAEIPESVALSA
jgi:transcriptional/translational regulatory protein YebC/TACO1